MKLDTVYVTKNHVERRPGEAERTVLEFVDNSGVEICKFNLPNPVRWSNFVIFLLVYNSKRAETY
jgi:hypothetical protein